MGGGVAGHPLDLPGHVHQLTDPLVPVVEVVQPLGQHQRLVQGHFRIEGHLLGDVVHLGIGEVENPPHVPDGGLGFHGAEGDDLHHVVLPVLPGHIVDDLLPPPDAEVDVDIGHGHPLGVQKPLEDQAVLDGVHVGDAQAVGHHGPGPGAAARAHRDAVFLGIADEVGHNEEVVHKPHLADDPHLHPQPVLQLLPAVRITQGKALPAQLFKIGIPVRLPPGQLELGQVVGAEVEVHIAQLHNLPGIVDGLGAVGEEGAHFLLAFHKELLGLKPHPLGVLHQLACLDAHEHVLHGGVLPGEVVAVVGGHQGNAGFAAQAQDARVDRLLLREVVVLDLQVVSVLAEQLPHLQGVGLRPLVVAGAQPPGDLPPQAGGQGDEAPAVGAQQVHVDPRLDVKALGKGHGHHITQVSVALLVPAKKHQVPGGRVQLVHPVEPGAGGHINLAANDGLDPRPLAGPVEVHRTVHHPVVGDGHGGLTQFLHPLHQLFDAAGAVQEGVFGMEMQMGKGHGKYLYLSIKIQRSLFVITLPMFAPAPRFPPPIPAASASDG